MVEIIKPYPFSPDFMIGTDGSVFNKKTGRFVGSKKGRYSLVSLSDKVSKSVHVLVAETFIPKPQGSNLCVNHKDLDKRNNHVTNLEWLTTAENLRHASENMAMAYGEKNPKAVLKEKDVVDICNRLERGEGTTKISQTTGINITTIHQIKSGDNWKHVSKHYRFDKKSYNKRLQEDTVRQVCKGLENGKRVSELVKSLGVSKDQVVKIKSRRNHRRISKDYKW